MTQNIFPGCIIQAKMPICYLEYRNILGCSQTLGKSPLKNSPFPPSSGHSLTSDKDSQARPTQHQQRPPQVLTPQPPRKGSDRSTSRRRAPPRHQTIQSTGLPLLHSIPTFFFQFLNFPQSPKLGQFLHLHWSSYTYLLFVLLSNIM